MYGDLGRPPLDERGLRRSLTGAADAPWSGLEVVAQTGSTNEDLLGRIARDRRPESLDRTVLLAEQQVAGRGRRSRSFECAPQSQVLMSSVLRLPGVPPDRLGWLPLLTGVAVVDALREVAEVDALLKWPNDVLVDGRKVAGILAEVSAPAARPGAPYVPMIVVGVGLNVSQSADELPVPTATSLAVEGAACLDRNTLVRAMLRNLASRTHRWQGMRGESPELTADYLRYCSTVGREVRALLPGGDAHVGRATGIDERGCLLIDAGPGGPVAVAAGDVEHVRPAAAPGAG
ncbi:biotin--[acetyl-CoA-carboxylase] ligase [Tomitella gaofuii]|uniref:biotin--[acetyl-CoA-carboxylase] ligase n=1 Tax=Tomitella gaofuii TaxID=2760083 RepID=UPI0015FDD323|nr:biotin--[acetyl-CoA-carboxylase] ligase [Tomitella gaofuii]